jgi:hypothetical protein
VLAAAGFALQPPPAAGLSTGVSPDSGLRLIPRPGKILAPDFVASE